MHLLALSLYALAIGALFSIFMREGVRDRIRFTFTLAGSMVGIAVAVGWIMYLVG
jgi:hypothetical protein